MNVLNLLKKLNPSFFFLILITVCFIFGFIYSSVWGLSFLKYYKLYKSVIIIIFSISLFFNVFVFKFYNYKKFLIHLLITFVILASSYHTHNFNVLLYWLILLTVAGISFKNISKIVLGLTVTGLLTVVTLILSGFGQNIIFERVGSALYFYRYSYGFFDPNIFSAYFVQICMALIYIRWKDFCAKDNILIFSIFCLTFFFANSRTSAVLILLLFIMTNCAKFLFKNEGYGIFKVSAVSSWVGVPLLSFVNAKLYCNSFGLSMLIDELVSCRFRNMCFCLSRYPISWFGNFMVAKNDLYILANLYGILLIRFGILVFVLFILALGLLIKKVCEKRNVPLLIIIIITLLQGVCEEYPLMPNVNYSLMALSCLLNNDKLFAEK